MKKKQQKQENYLEKIPNVAENFTWDKDEKGIVTINIENKGVFNRIAQKLFKKPKVSYVHLDEFGSFVWQQIDGEKNILSIGDDVKAQFAEKADPLYERLAKYFEILKSYGFINWKS